MSYTNLRSNGAVRPAVRIGESALVTGACTSLLDEYDTVRDAVLGFSTCHLSSKWA